MTAGRRAHWSAPGPWWRPRRSRSPDLTPRLEPVATAHAAHLEVLEGAVADADVPTAAAAPRPGRPGRGADRRCGARSSGCCARCAAGASPPPSGDLARVLASMAASTAQHGAALADPAAGQEAVVTVLDALQATLADEHAALYTYGVLGARTSQATRPRALRRP